MTCPPLPPDHGWFILWGSLWFGLGAIIGKLISDAEHRRPPPG